jgi:DNA replication licensing factor MCM2
MRMMVRNEMDDGEGNASDDDNYQNILDFEDVKGPLSIWLKKPDVIKFIHRQFGQFLRNYREEDGKFVYEEKIHTMCQNNKQSLEVTFSHLSSKYPTLAIWLAEEPALMLPILNNVAQELVSEVYPDYHNTHDNIFVRVRDLPVEDKLRDLRQVHLNALIKIRGVVTKRTGVFPEEKISYYRCLGCQDIKGPFMNNKQDDVK